MHLWHYVGPHPKLIQTMHVMCETEAGVLLKWGRTYGHRQTIAICRESHAEADDVMSGDTESVDVDGLSVRQLELWSRSRAMKLSQMVCQSCHWLF